MIIQSMGMGVQSVTMAAMSCLGDLPMPDLSVFADTGWELDETMEYAEWFTRWAAERGLEIVTAKNGDIRADAFKPGRWANMPLYVLGDEGKPAPILRQCSLEYKIKVVHDVARRRLGLPDWRNYKGEPITIWLGYSLDEVERMKESDAKYYRNDWPLIMQKRMNRGDCERYLKAHGLPIPEKSACVGCPWRTDASWASMKRHKPAQFAEAVDFDAKIRHARPGMEKPVYLHKSLTPLSEANFGEDQTDMFLNQCDGPCNT
jgi:hypothetical protein